MRTLRKYTGILVKIHGFALIFLFLFSYATPQLSKAFAQDKDDWSKVLRASPKAEAIEGEFLALYKTDKGLKSLSKGEKPNWIKKLGKNVKIDTSLAEFNIAYIRISNPAATGQWENLANILSSDPNISHVEPNYVRYGLGNVPNDPYMQELWHLGNISTFKAWDTLSKSTNEDIIVAVVDTGIQLNHEDLKGHIWRNPKEVSNNNKDDDGNGYVDDVVGWNFIDDNPMPYSYLNPERVISFDPQTGEQKCSHHPTKSQYETHGTHVAGIIAGVRNNKLGIAGITNKIKIMPIRVLGGTCTKGDSMTILRGIQYAANNGAKIINMSLGGYGSTIMEQRVFEKISNKGILIVASAGNDSNNNDVGEPHIPSDLPVEGIISVAASDENNKLAQFSNYGKTHVDLAAPGVEILSSIPYDTGENWPKSEYIKISGTSMATPVVSGAAALLLSQDNTLTNIQLKHKLLSSVDRFPDFEGKMVSNGRLNIYKALTSRTVVNQNTHTAATNKPKSRFQTNSIGGIRIFDKRENKQKW